MVTNFIVRLNGDNSTVINPPDNLQQDDQGWMEKECGHCRAKYFSGEAVGRGDYTRCCQDGKIDEDFTPVTQISNNAYPIYRRRSDNTFVTKGNNELDNRRVVP